MNEIFKKLCENHERTVEEIRSDNRWPSLVKDRQRISYILRNEYAYTLEAIGEMMNCNHSTISLQLKKYNPETDSVDAAFIERRGDAKYYMDVRARELGFDGYKKRMHSGPRNLIFRELVLIGYSLQIIKEAMELENAGLKHLCDLLKNKNVSKVEYYCKKNMKGNYYDRAA